MNMRIVTAGALALGWTMAGAVAQEPALGVGDAAPALQVGKWVQGDPVEAFAPGTAYVVEFWATWCGPCRTSIPHLNEIHEKYKDQGLVVIGQDVWERDESLVAPFLEEMGEKMTYRVALDDKTDSEQGRMAETWMAAAGQNGIPTAFVVDKAGKIAWIGHPMALPETLLEQVLAGTFDLEQAARDHAAEQASQAARDRQTTAYRNAMQEERYDDAASALAGYEELLPEAERPMLAMAWFDLKLRSGDPSGAQRVAREASEAVPGNASFQNALAWTLTTHPLLEKPDLDLARTIALRANEAAGGTDPSVVDTLARVTFMRGDHDEAVALQKKAVDLAPEAQREALRETLSSYEAGRLPER